MMNYWLIKSEGDCYSIDDLKKDKRTAWTGIRNYQARNFMRDSMKIGDKVLFYHSNGKGEAPSGIYGIAKVVSKPHADETQFNKGDMHFDPRAKKDAPIWQCVDMAFVSKCKKPLSLAQLRADPNLRGLAILAPGSRLSVTPVSPEHFKYITESLTL